MTAHVPHHVPAVVTMPAHHVMATVTAAHHAVMAAHAVMIMHPYVHDGAGCLGSADHTRAGGGGGRKANHAQGRHDGKGE